MTTTWRKERRGRGFVARAQGETAGPGRSVGPREKSTARRCAPPRSVTSDTYEGDAGTLMRGSSESNEDDRDAAAKPGQKAADGVHGMTATPLMPTARAGGTGQA